MQLGPRGRNLASGSPSQPGRNALQRRDGQDIELPSKCQLTVEEGDRLTLETPGGGGWGRPQDAPTAATRMEQPSLTGFLPLFTPLSCNPSGSKC